MHEYVFMLLMLYANCKISLETKDTANAEI